MLDRITYKELTIEELNIIIDFQDHMNQVVIPDIIKDLQLREQLWQEYLKS